LLSPQKETYEGCSGEDVNSSHDLPSDTFPHHKISEPIISNLPNREPMPARWPHALDPQPLLVLAAGLSPLPAIP